MVGTKSPSSADATYLRKIRKPLVEKRRRDRMNASLEQLKSLLAVNIKQTSSTPLARLDKADILELTVGRLTTLDHQQRSTRLAKDVDGYKQGFKDCARETIRFLSSTRSVDTTVINRLNIHLHSSYIGRTKRTADASLPVHATQAHDNFSVPLRISDVTNPKVYPLTDCVDYYEKCYRQGCYTPCNDSVNTSLNSSNNMSLDSSDNCSPEKVDPYQSVSDDLWRPW